MSARATIRLLGTALLVAHFGLPQLAIAEPAVLDPHAVLLPADFEGDAASPDARHIADWIQHSGDNLRMPYVIVDKVRAKVFAFDGVGRLVCSSPALLGLARGDDAVAGIGTRALSTIRPGERTTPAGRFVASLDQNLHGQEILWVDYESSVSLHRVVTSNAKEHRAERLASATPLDNRITYGCINVPPAFYELVSAAFAGTQGIVYVLPETRSSRSVFHSYGAGAAGW